MRRVRGGRNKDVGILVNMALVAKDYWLTYLVLFLSGLLGTLLGVLVGKITSTLLVLVVVIFLGMVTAGLIVAWSINQKNQILEAFTLQQGFREQYNALHLLIGELELNLNAESGRQVSSDVWSDLKYQYAYFPTYIYEDLERAYSQLADLEELELDIVEYRRIIIEELRLPELLSELRDHQYKIKRQLPYLE